MTAYHILSSPLPVSLVVQDLCRNSPTEALLHVDLTSVLTRARTMLAMEGYKLTGFAFIKALEATQKQQQSLPGPTELLLKQLTSSTKLLEVGT